MSANPAELHALIDAARRDYDDLMRRLLHNEAEFRRLGRAVFRVQEDERRRIARELHDGVGQNLTALKHQLQLLRDQRDLDADTLQARCAELIGLVGDTLQDTRQMSRLLRPQILDDLGLDAALAWLVRSLSTPTGPAIELDIDESAEWDADQASLVFRIAQEALTNALKHAQATRIELTLDSVASGLRLTVTDDGHGFEARGKVRGEAPTTGLSSMRERVHLFGGRFSVRSSIGAGCTIEAILPVNPDTHEPDPMSRERGKSP
jgi:signal transduction histidine kinase